MSDDPSSASRGHATVDEEAFAALKEEIAAYVANEGEEWTRRIEDERAVPPELRDELRERGYLLARRARASTAARGIPFSRYLELLELFAMSHASLRMIVHVANGVWRSVDQFATEEQRREYVLPRGDRRAHGRLHADRADRRDRRRPALRGRARGRHLLPLRREAPDHLRRRAATAGCSSPGSPGPTAPRARSRCWSTATTPGVQVEDMGESLGVRGTDHAHLVFDRAPVPVGEPARRGGQRPRGRLRRLPHAEPDRGRDDLRRPRPARPGAGRGARAIARHLRQAARRSARRSPSPWPRTPPTSKRRGSSSCTRRATGRQGARRAGPSPRWPS